MMSSPAGTQSQKNMNEMNLYPQGERFNNNGEIY